MNYLFETKSFSNCEEAAMLFGWFNNDKLSDAISSNDIVRVEQLIASGADVNKPNKNGIFPLFQSLGARNYPSRNIDIRPKIALILIRSGANVNAVDKDKWPVLNHAIGTGEFELVESVIRAGADISRKRFNEWTPLHDAVAFRKEKDIDARIKIIKLLIHAGVDVNMTNSGQYLFNGGQTPLSEAIHQENHEIVRVLIDEGAQFDANDLRKISHWDRDGKYVKHELLKYLEQLHTLEAFWGTMGGS